MERIGNKRVIFEFEDFVLDPHEKTLLFRGRAVHLTPKEFETLVLLVENNGKALSKHEMMSALWEDAFVEESNLAKQISQLRKVLNRKGGKLIETVPKHGYRFHAEISRTEIEPESEVVFASRSVRRLTVAGIDHYDNELLALPPARRSFSRNALMVLLIAGVGVVFVGLYLGRQIFSSSAAPIDPYAPVRLTDNPNDDTGPRWMRDGRIRFSRIYGEKRDELWIMNADGSDQRLEQEPSGKTIFTWSPDEKKITYTKSDDPKQQQYLSNADGSGEVLLPFRGGGRWSEDGKMITYFQRTDHEDSDIFVYSVETGRSQNITDHRSFNADPSFSPDGKQIAFDSFRDGNQEIYLMNTDGTGLRRLTFTNAGNAHPAFSPDGTQILFTSNRDSENAEVYMMNADGSHVTRMTNWDRSNQTAGPGSWSPDGTQIAFFSDKNGGHDDIYVMSADAIRPRLILSDPDHDLRNPSYPPDGKSIIYTRELDDKSGELRTFIPETRSSAILRKTETALTVPRWSPDGRSIAYYDRVDGHSEIFCMDADGSNTRRLTVDPTPNVGPSWSPDGSKIVFQSGRGVPLGRPQLYVMGPDGSNQHPLTPQKGWEGDPIWTPDGLEVVFSCDREDSPGAMMDICDIKADGTSEKRLISHPGYDVQPEISPDGKRIAFVANSDGNPEIYMMNRDGSSLVRLTRNAANDESPYWSPDSTKLLFNSNRSGRYAIYEIDVP